MELRKIEEIQERLTELGQKQSYLKDFLEDCYKGSDAREKVSRELASIRREIYALRWCVKDDEDLPF